MEQADMAQALARVFEAAGCRTQVDLAAFLGIRQSSISDAKKRKAVPAEWLITLLRLKGVNPEWVFTGSGARYLLPYPDGARGNRPVSEEEQSAIRPGILRCFPAQALADELVRRILAEKK